MPAPNRTALLTKLHKTLKKTYTPSPPNLKLPLLQQLLYACCLEEATPAAAAKAFAALEEQFFDWNEVRVSTVTELAESMAMLSQPVAAASRVKRVLQSVFEANYAFDIESLKKQNIGAAQKRLAKYDGVTPFGVAYATQTGLGGHSIPLGRGALDVLYIVGIISDKERTTGEVSGLERAIPKNKGIEFGSLVNQLGVEYAKNPMAPAVRKYLLSIAPDAKDRFPKRARPEAEPAAAADGAVPAPGAEAKGGRKGEVIAPHVGKKPAAGTAPASGAKPDASSKVSAPAKAVKSPAPAKARPAAKAPVAPPAAKKGPIKGSKLPARGKSGAHSGLSQSGRGAQQSGRGAPRKPR